MISIQAATRAVSELALLPWFPTDQDARLALVRMLAMMVVNAGRTPSDTNADANRKDNEALIWLVDRALVLLRRWDGPRELRAIYCSRFPPGDGHEASSATFPDGVPFDHTLPGAPVLQIESGDTLRSFSADEIDDIRRKLVAMRPPKPARRDKIALRDWINQTFSDIILLDSQYDNAIVGVASLGSVYRACYDIEGIIEILMAGELLTPDEAESAAGMMQSAAVLFLHRPAPNVVRPLATKPITQDDIARAEAAVRANRAGWTPERIANIIPINKEKLP